MNWVATVILLAVAFLAVYAESSFNELRRVIGVQIDLLPSLMVYAGLSYGLGVVVVLAVCGGLWFDSLSANPLGVSVLPLFLAGFAIQHYRGLILRDQIFAQWVLGLVTSAMIPVLTVVLLINLNTRPLVSWFSLWQWFVMAMVGGAITPLWFALFDRIHAALVYRPVGDTSFRTDREIKRGRQ
jgi:cell shape-determining protein MreD